MAKMDKDYRARASELLAQAHAKGLEDNVLFKTTYERYCTQVDIMESLKASIEEDGPLVTKEYVKGRGNLYVNPAITEYNRTASAANITVNALLNILKAFPAQEEAGLTTILSTLDDT